MHTIESPFWGFWGGVTSQERSGRRAPTSCTCPLGHRSFLLVEKDELLAVVAAYPAPFSGDPRVKDDLGRGPVLVLEDGQATYGVAQFDETDRIPELCRSLGLSYHLFDDGHYEHDGSDVMWAPGIEAPRERARLASGTRLASE